MTALAPTLQSFFTHYLIGQRGASGHTITAYRDTLRLLLGYVHQRTGIRPSDLDITVCDADLVGDFLDMLQARRGNITRTRNARLAAIHSLFNHAALRHPEHADLIARVLAIPPRTPTMPSSPTSPTPRSTRCWPAPIALPGPGVAITYSCWSWSPPACGSRN